MEAWEIMKLKPSPLKTTATAAQAVLTGQPYVFYKDNMAEWVDVL